MTEVSVVAGRSLVSVVDAAEGRQTGVFREPGLVQDGQGGGQGDGLTEALTEAHWRRERLMVPVG